MLATVRSYENEIVYLLNKKKNITIEQISNLYGYAECIASGQRQCEHEFNKQVT